jgi:hypothetical protein
MLHQVFWNLLFASAKQATVVREKLNYPYEDWQANDGAFTSCWLAGCNGLAELQSGCMLDLKRLKLPDTTICATGCSQTSDKYAENMRNMQENMTKL